MRNLISLLLYIAILLSYLIVKDYEVLFLGLAWLVGYYKLVGYIHTSNISSSSNFIYKVKFKKLFDSVDIPKYAHKGDVGFDLIAHSFDCMYTTMINGKAQPIDVKGTTKLLLVPHGRVMVNMGYSLELPPQTQLEIRGRSGNALKKGLVLAHGVGTIDNEYTGEIAFIVLNTSDYPIEISLGDKIGQAVLMPYYVASFKEVDKLSKTERGKRGFGSTGK